MSSTLKQEKIFDRLMACAKELTEHEPSDTPYHKVLGDIKEEWYDECRKRPTGREVGEIMEHFVNCISMKEEEDEFIEYVVHRTHRTLNQSIIGLLFKVLLEESRTNRFDGRNEASVMACRELAPILKESYLPFV